MKSMDKLCRSFPLPFPRFSRRNDLLAKRYIVKESKRVAKDEKWWTNCADPSSSLFPDSRHFRSLDGRNDGRPLVVAKFARDVGTDLIAAVSKTGNKAGEAGGRILVRSPRELNLDSGRGKLETRGFKIFPDIYSPPGMDNNAAPVSPPSPPRITIHTWRVNNVEIISPSTYFTGEWMDRFTRHGSNSLSLSRLLVDKAEAKYAENGKRRFFLPLWWKNKRNLDVFRVFPETNLRTLANSFLFLASLTDTRKPRYADLSLSSLSSFSRMRSSSKRTCFESTKWTLLRLE